MYVIDVSTGSSGEVEIAPCIRIDTQELSIDHTIVEIAVLETSGLITRCGWVLEVRELKSVDLRTDRCLNLQLRNDVIHNLSVHTKQVLVGPVLVLVDIPIRVDVIRIHTVPVLVLTINVLIVLKPRLIISGSQRHQVLTYVGFVITKGRTVFNVLVCEIDIEI